MHVPVTYKIKEDQMKNGTLEIGQDIIELYFRHPRAANSYVAYAVDPNCFTLYSTLMKVNFEEKNQQTTKII